MTSESEKLLRKLDYHPKDAEKAVISLIGNICRQLNTDANEAEKIIEKAIIGGEITSLISPENWLQERFLLNCVTIDEDGYAKMCIDALKIVQRTAPTDYGSARQRDLGQLWADMTRGYLGELALEHFLKEYWNIDIQLGHEVGTLEEYLPTDVHKVREPGAEWRTPKIKISVKTTKWNGIWLDIPGDQFSHSDIHILVKIGVNQNHLFAFFKKISVFKDKVLKIGENIGSLTKEESAALFDMLPSFKPIPAYICGFVMKNTPYQNLSYTGKKGRKNFTITSWNGPILPGDLDEIKSRESVSGSVKFEGIGKFAHDRGYLFNTGSLVWQKDKWQEVCSKI